MWNLKRGGRCHQRAARRGGAAADLEYRGTGDPRRPAVAVVHPTPAARAAAAVAAATTAAETSALPAPLACSAPGASAVARGPGQRVAESETTTDAETADTHDTLAHAHVQVTRTAGGDRCPGWRTLSECEE